jgi:hypothetical protein
VVEPNGSAPGAFTTGRDRQIKKARRLGAWKGEKSLKQADKPGRNAAGSLFLLVLLGFFDFFLLTVVALGHNRTPYKGLKKT